MNERPRHNARRWHQLSYSEKTMILRAQFGQRWYMHPEPERLKFQRDYDDKPSAEREAILVMAALR